MKITLIRHGKVDMQWQKAYTSRAYDRACSAYDLAPIVPIDNLQIQRDAEVIYVSSLSRSRRTAEQLFGMQDFIETKLLDEVPLRSFCDCRISLPLWLWNVGGRLQWLWQSRRQREGRIATGKRAARLISGLLKKDQDCILVSHGFYMRTLVKELKRQGFAINKSGMGIANLAQIIATK